MKYKVGDMVRVRPDLSESMEFDDWDGHILFVASNMASLAGKVVTIESIDSHGYRIKECDKGKIWVDEMFYEPDTPSIELKIDSDKSHDPVSNPSHYTSGGIECIDAMIAAYGKETVSHFCICNAFKYLWRHLQKGNAKQDCKKAQWYINKYLELMEE